MFELWKLKRQRRKVSKAYQSDLRKLAKKKAPQEERYVVQSQEYYELQEIDRALDMEISDRLFRKASELDVEFPPPVDGAVWFKDEHSGRVWFTPKGRNLVRKLIDEEKSRHFEVTTRWVKLLSPLIAAIAGLVGVITGLVAVWKK
jgi:hypothetical protein